MKNKKLKKCVFLDRDGTIIFDYGYISVPTNIKVIPEAFSALKKLKKAGFLLVIISNQSGVGRGYFQTEDVDKVNNKILEMAKMENLDFDGVYYCPHHPDDNCSCRKPAPGMLLKAAKEFGINIHESVMIGDKESDILTGINAGCKINILIAGNNRHANLPQHCFSAKNLAEAVKIVLTEKVHKFKLIFF